jgi:RHS repeat-associated protein
MSLISRNNLVPRLVVFVVVMVLTGVFSAEIYADDAATYAQVMRKIQARYHWLMKNTSTQSTKYIDWGSVNGKPIPSYPNDSFFDECEIDLLDTRIRDAYYNPSEPDKKLKGRFYSDTPEGQTDLGDICVSYDIDGNTSIETLNGWLDEMVYYSAPVDLNDDVKVGHKWDSTDTSTDIDENYCVFKYVTRQVYFENVRNDALLLNDGTNCISIDPGVYLSVYSSEMIEDNNCNGSYDSNSYSVLLYENRAQITCDLLGYSDVSSSSCYIMLRQSQYSGCPSPAVDLPCPDGTTDSNPVTVDEVYNQWTGGGTPSVGSIWTSSPLFTSSPTIYKGNYAKGWSLLDKAVFLKPSFSSEVSSTGEAPKVTEYIYKDFDKYTVYSASDGCGFGEGETINGDILTPIGTYTYQYFIEDYDTLIAVLDLDSDNYTDGPTDRWQEYYNPDIFKITAKVGQTNITFKVRTWQKNTAADGKVTVGKGETSISFTVKTNGYECCNRSNLNIDVEIPPYITRHENGDIEILYNDIQQSYIWGNYDFEFAFGFFYKVCPYLEERLFCGAGTNELVLSALGANNLIYITNSIWCNLNAFNNAQYKNNFANYIDGASDYQLTFANTTLTKETAQFYQEVDENGNPVREASHDPTSGNLTKITRAINGVLDNRLYREFYYNDSTYPNRITSYTDYAGNQMPFLISRTYYIEYENNTGRVSGVTGGSSSCSSCSSTGQNHLYTYNDYGSVLTEYYLIGDEPYVVYEYEYDTQNRLTNKWLGEMADGHPVKFIEYDTDAQGNSIRDTYEYVTDADYRLTREVLTFGGRISVRIEFEALNINASIIPDTVNDDTAAIIAMGGLVTVYEYEYDGNEVDSIKIKTPLFNEGEIDSCRKRDPHSGGSQGYDKEYLIINEGTVNETEIQLSKTSYNSLNQVTNEWDWYGLAGNDQSVYSYDTSNNNRLYRIQESDGNQLNGDSTRLRRDYDYHSDGRMDTETLSDGGSSAGKTITIYKYDTINQPAGIMVTDYESNILYETSSKSTGLGDVIYTVDRTGVARGKEYDSFGRIISEFVFADPTDVSLFANASTQDISSQYSLLTVDVNGEGGVISQTRYYYDAVGRLEYVYKAVDEAAFDYDIPSGWYKTRYIYDSYGRKYQQIEDSDGLALTTTYIYNNKGELEKIIHPDGHWTTQLRDGRGLVTKTEEGYTNSSSQEIVLNCSETEYDSDGRVFKTCKGIGSEKVVTASYEYDDLGNIYRHYQGDFETENCSYVQYIRNYAGDIECQKHVNVDSTTGFETVVKELQYSYNSRGEKIEERVIYNLSQWSSSSPDNFDYILIPNTFNDSYDRIKLFIYDYQGRLIESVTKADGNTQPYTDSGRDELNYQAGDRVEQNWYNLTGELEYNVQFNCVQGTSYVITPYSFNYTNTINDVYCYAKYVYSDPNNDITVTPEYVYIEKNNYSDGKLSSRQVLTGHDTAHSNYDDYLYYNNNYDAGLVWLTTAGYSYDNAGRTWKAYDADYDMEYTLENDSTLYTHTYNNYTETLYNSLNQPVAQTLWQVKPTLRINELLDLTSAPGENPIAVSRVLTSYNNRGQKDRVAVFIDPSGHSDTAPLEFDDVVYGTDKATDYTYDAYGRQNSIRELLNYESSIQLGYSKSHHAYTKNGYDEIGRVWQTESGYEEEYVSFLGATYAVAPYKTIDYEYNTLGQREYQTVTDIDPTNSSNTVVVTNRYGYTNQGQLETVETYDGSNYDYTAIYSYDVLGRRTSYQDGDGLTTYFSYYYTGELADKIENPLSSTLKRTTTYGYDRFGRQTSIAATENDDTQNSRTTSYDYNYLDKITKISYPGSNTLEYAHDMRGNVILRIEDPDVTQTTPEDRIWTHYKHDEMGRVVGKAYGQTVDWTEMGVTGWFDQIVYNALGLKDKITKFDGSSDSIFYYYVYDGLGNLTQSVENCGDFDGVTIDYGYDCRGNLVWVTYPNERTVEYNRSQYGIIDDITYNGLDIISYDYIGSRIAAKQFGNGIEYSVLFDGVGRITDEDYSRGSSVLASADYGYTANSHSSRLASRGGAAYSYDNLGKLTGEASSSYTSDYLGNPTNAADDGLTYGVDAENRVVDVDDSYGDVAGYTYDMLGRRIKKTVGSLTTWFVYDKMGNVISEYEQIGTGGINWARDYVYGASGEVVYMQMPPQSYTTVYEWFVDFADAWLCYPDCTSNELTAWDTNDDDEIDGDDLVEWVPVIADEVFYSQRSYIFTDYKGSVIAKTNDEGGIDEISYDAWGQATVAQGVDLQGLSILWNGYYYDYETGNYYLKNRYYSPTMRKFITEDPHGVNPDGNWNNSYNPLIQLTDGFGLSVYAQHAPVNGRDDWGLKRIIALLNGQDMMGLTGNRTLEDALSGESWNADSDNIVKYFQEDGDWFGFTANWIKSQVKRTPYPSNRLCDKIILVGHSNGGDGARKVAKQLQQNLFNKRSYPVELLFLFDPIGKPWHPGAGRMMPVSSNVRKSVGVRQNVDSTFSWNFFGLFGFKMHGYSIPGMIPRGNPWTPNNPADYDSAHTLIIHQFKKELETEINRISP